MQNVSTLFFAEYTKYYNDEAISSVTAALNSSSYRLLVAVPGGLHSDLGNQIAKAASDFTLTCRDGLGNDSSNYMSNSVYIYDTASFPFFQGKQSYKTMTNTQNNDHAFLLCASCIPAEIYNQFHEDYADVENYPYGYLYCSTKLTLEATGRLSKETGCPEDETCECC